ncbi:hypothetical protein C8R21_11233 [Nitrosospira multiformis]|uniref:Uncharacterized protein n=1 Tax=Nitrosospira multiformis TaxID=1231 RepID=A0A2T5IB10_9PROT|nr:hypothetical protein C8R21_11233 [Nitrosospira multiformis]
MTSPLCPFYLRDYGQGFPCSVCPFGGQPNAGTLQIAFSQAVIRDQDRHDLRLSDSGGLRLRRRRLVRALPLGYI